MLCYCHWNLRFVNLNFEVVITTCSLTLQIGVHCNQTIFNAYKHMYESNSLFVQSKILCPLDEKQLSNPVIDNKGLFHTYRESIEKKS